MESGAAVGPYLGFQISYGNQANPIVNPECDLRHGPSSERVRRRAYPNNRKFPRNVHIEDLPLFPCPPYLMRRLSLAYISP